MTTTYTPVLNAPKQCPYCEENFTPKYKNRTYCYEAACHREHRRLQMRAYVEKYKAEHGHTPTQKYRPAGTPRAPRKTHTNTCVLCLSEYQTKDPRSRFCSPTCTSRGAGGWSTSRDIVKATRPPRRALTRGTTVWTTGRCAECRTWFTSDRPTNKYCSDTCKARRRAWARARERGEFAIDTATRRAVYERDGWECHLCRQPVPMTWEPNDPDSPSLDHIIPRSWALVPDDSPTNLSLSHLKCNVYRGNQTVSEFRGYLRGLKEWVVSEW